MIEFNFGYFSSERKAIMGLAILWIMFFHCSGDYRSIPVIAGIKHFGNLGVEIFLLLSGVGLYYSAQNLHSGLGKNWIIEFYKKRFIRILPPTIICLLPWYLYLYNGQDTNPLRVFLDITSLSFWIDGKNRGWYVALTIVLYSFYPLLYCLVVKSNPKKLFYCIFLIVSDIFLNTAIALFNPDWFEMVNLALCRAPIFIAGCFLAPLVRDGRKQKCLPPICSLAIPFLVFILLRFMGAVRAYGMWRYLYAVLGFCASVILVLLFHTVHEKWISRFFGFFGEYTLELYLTHTQFLTVFEHHLKPMLSIKTINVLAVGCSIITAIIVHEGITYVKRTVRPE
ncbi:MAG: acyltransferase [Blautia sp.]|nr:acyltransferase [Blautia sp.]